MNSYTIQKTDATPPEPSWRGFAHQKDTAIQHANDCKRADPESDYEVLHFGHVIYKTSTAC